MRCGDVVLDDAVDVRDDAYSLLRGLVGKRSTLHSQREACAPGSECHWCCYTPPCVANRPRRQESDSCRHLLALEDTWRSTARMHCTRALYYARRPPELSPLDTGVASGMGPGGPRPNSTSARKSPCSYPSRGPADTNMWHDVSGTSGPDAPPPVIPDRARRGAKGRGQEKGKDTEGGEEDGDREVASTVAPAA